MDAVTYPNDRVKAELGSWVMRKVDISEVPSEVPQAFSVVVIPVAIALDGEGRVLDRLAGFMEPGDFRDRLARIRGRR